MSLTFALFQEQVAAYTNRAPASYVVGSNNLLQLAINDAKRDGQLECDFHECRTDAYIVTGPNGAALSTATTGVGGTGTAVRLRKVRKLWSVYNSTSRYAPIPIEDESVLERISPTEYDPTSKVRAFFRGKLLVVTGGTNTSNFLIDGFKWMPDYDGSVTSDFFLTDYSSWLLLRSIYCLNLYLKEDQRVPLSMSALMEAWERVLKNENSFLPNSSLD